MTAEKSYRTVLTLGAAGHGKSLLARALALRAGAPLVPSHHDLPVTEVHYETARYRFEHLDCRAADLLVRLVVLGAPEVALVVVAADVGTTEDLVRQLHLARDTGVAQVAVFLSRTDLSSDVPFLDLIEWEVRQRLSELGWRGDEVPVVQGSAWGALRATRDSPAWRAIDDLLRALRAIHDSLPPPVSPNDGPFLMPVSSVIPARRGLLLPSRPVLAVGRIRRGRVAEGDVLERVGLGPTRQFVVAGLHGEQTGRSARSVTDNVIVTLKDVRPGDLEPGQVLAAPGSLRAHARFEAVVALYSGNEGGRRTPVFDGYRPQWQFEGGDFSGTLTFPEGQTQAGPGEVVRVRVAFTPGISLALEAGWKVALAEGARQVGWGVVTRLVTS